MGGPIIIVCTRLHTVLNNWKFANQDIWADDEFIILAQILEHDSSVVQNAAKGFHCDSSQYTLHPFVGYFKNNVISKTEPKT